MQKEEKKKKKRKIEWRSRFKELYEITEKTRF